MRIEIEGGRQFGRTWRQLAALPDGSIFLVPTEAIAGYCRNLLRGMGRQPGVIRFATPANFCRFQGARASAFDTDHSVWDLRCPRGREAADFLSLTVSPYA